MISEAPGICWRADDGLHIDTRGLNPPDPMIAILWRIEQPDQNGPIIAHFDRNPVHLFAELAERGWSYDYLQSDLDEVRLSLRKGA